LKVLDVIVHCGVPGCNSGTIMKKIHCDYLFLAAIMLCTYCQKREVAIVQENAESSSPKAIEASADNDTIIIQPGEVEVKTIQETIENYTFPSTVRSVFEQGLFAFQIEGNFTGSGNREIIAFYKFKGRDSINAAFCFVCDSSGEKTKNVYYIYYITIEFSEMNDKDTGLVEITDLGRAITYKERIIGRVSDFNGNGKEELYLYARSGRNIEPAFFEFNGTEFREIITLGSPDAAPIISIDPQKKIITLNRRSYLDDNKGVDLIERTNSYIWDDAIHQYEELTSEYKEYRWNRTSREYEEIE